MQLLNLSQNSISNLNSKEDNDQDSLRRYKNYQHSEFPFPSSLTYLNWSGNDLTTFPKLFGPSLHNLKSLDLSENFLEELPEEFVELKQLEKLYLDCNFLTTLPQEFSSLTQLKLVQLSNNMFSAIPNQLASLPNLAQADLSGNPVAETNGSMYVDYQLNNGSKISISMDYPVPDEILPKLYLGDWNCARNKHALQKLNITHILCVAQFQPLYPQLFTYKIVDIPDANSEDIFSHFPASIDFINQARQSGSIFVHCRAGVSRSPTVVIAYLMKENNMSLDEAFNFVKQRRSRIEPNSGFIAVKCLCVFKKLFISFFSSNFNVGVMNWRRNKIPN